MTTKRLTTALGLLLLALGHARAQEETLPEPDKSTIQGHIPSVMGSRTEAPDAPGGATPDFTKLTRDAVALESMRKTFSKRKLTEEEREKMRQDVIAKFERGGVDSPAASESAIVEAVRKAARKPVGGPEETSLIAPEVSWPIYLVGGVGVVAIAAVFLRRR